MLGIILFQLIVVLKPLTKMFAVNTFGLYNFWSVRLAFTGKDCNFVTQGYAKK